MCYTSSLKEIGPVQFSREERRPFIPFATLPTSLNLYILHLGTGSASSPLLYFIPTQLHIPDSMSTSHRDKDNSSCQAGEKKSPEDHDNRKNYSGPRFALLMTSTFAAMFLVSLVRDKVGNVHCHFLTTFNDQNSNCQVQDKLIITTAIPQITDEFNSKDHVGWYGTAYLLTNCSFQLVFGKLYKFLPIKSTFLASLLLFEVGSAICGAAPNSIALIFGRVIAGLGAGGILPGVVSSRHRLP